jgi:hypothetical protein
LQVALREDLGSLVQNLERSGFHAETFVPVQSIQSSQGGSAANSGNDHAGSHSDSSAHSGFQGPDSQSRGQGGHTRERSLAAWQEIVDRTSFTEEASS